MGNPARSERKKTERLRERETYLGQINRFSPPGNENPADKNGENINETRNSTDFKRWKTLHMIVKKKMTKKQNLALLA